MQTRESNLAPSQLRLSGGLAPLEVMSVGESLRLNLLWRLSHLIVLIVVTLCVVSLTNSLLQAAFFLLVFWAAILLSFTFLRSDFKPYRLSFDGQHWQQVVDTEETDLGQMQSARFWGGILILRFKPQHHSVNLLVSSDAMEASQFKALRRWIVLHLNEVG